MQSPRMPSGFHNKNNQPRETTLLTGGRGIERRSSGSAHHSLRDHFEKATETESAVDIITPKMEPRITSFGAQRLG